MSLCESKDSKKICSCLKNCCFGFCTFGFEAIPHPSCFLTSILDKTHHEPVIAPFSVQLLQHFQLRRRCHSNQPFFTVILVIYFCYSASCNTRGALNVIIFVIILGDITNFVIIFLIRSDLLNCLRSVSTMVITTEQSFSHISSSNKNINNTARVSRLSFRFLRLRSIVFL